MIFSVAMRAIKEDVEPAYFAIWVEEFYSSMEKTSVYFEACQSGSAKKENVQKRLNAINNAYSGQFPYSKDTEQRPQEDTAPSEMGAAV
jgi:hypothetical protein